MELKLSQLTTEDDTTQLFFFNFQNIHIYLRNKNCKRLQGFVQDISHTVIESVNETNQMKFSYLKFFPNVKIHNDYSLRKCDVQKKLSSTVRNYFQRFDAQFSFIVKSVDLQIRFGFHSNLEWFQNTNSFLLFSRFKKKKQATKIEKRDEKLEKRLSICKEEDDEGIMIKVTDFTSHI